MTRWVLFALVEGLAELLRQHLQHASSGPFSSGVGSGLACSCWAFGAHQRFAFRGLASPFKPRLGGLAPFLAASWAVIDFQLLLGLTGSPPVGFAAWAGGAVAKYLIVRAVIWPLTPATRLGAARP